MPTAQKAGFETYWTTFGNGPAAALMIHCSLAHSGSWAGLARELSGALDMTAFDMPGHGRSGAWDNRGELQKITAEIAADFLDAPTHIIGHSFGATVALRLAVMRPDLVRSLVLIEPVFFAVGLLERPEMRAAFEAQMSEFQSGMRSGDMQMAARGFLRVWGDGPEWESLPEVEQAMLAGQMHLVAAGAAALHEDVGGMLDPGVLQAISVPALLLEGSASPPIIEAINAGLSARLPKVDRAVLAGAGHMLPITHPAQVGAEVLRFLRRA